MEVKRLKYLAGGEWLESKTDKYMDVFNPSTGEIIAKTPCCTVDEVNYAVECAKKAYTQWSDTPVIKRTQVIFNFRNLIISHMDELTELVAREEGKNWNEAKGDILKVKEPVELALSAPSLLMGESFRDTSFSYDTTLYRESVGVFAGIVPFNFPGMIPMGWMTPMCIACGNTIVLKAASMTPMTCMRLADLWKEAGLPDGVINIVTCSRNEAETLIKHADVKGITFVGSTSVGRHIYAEAAAAGKRVQCLCEAKNHALVLEDAAIERTARGIINSAFGCAGERCMALPVVVAQESIADSLVAHIKKYASELKIGPAYDKTPELGPVVSAGH
ncbi:MAG: aldehyde dehydrogenase family protein, partial [Clostridiales bacterium]|nr:aldehyde dehydrogenase family protein [Clostridiales bacterium]